MSRRVLDFAWLRERIGESAELLDTRAATVAALVAELRGRGIDARLLFVGDGARPSDRAAI